MTQVAESPAMQETTRDIAQAKQLYDQALKALANGQIETAIDRLDEAHELDHENEEVMFKLAYLLDLRGADQRAIEVYEILADRRPVREGVLLNLSILYEDIGRYDDAEECLTRLLTVNPNHPRGKLYQRDVDSSLSMTFDEDSEKRSEKRNALLETPVTDFELSVRARNCLKKMNIRTLGDLLKITEAELLGYKNFGETSLEEIKTMLTNKGLRLGQALEEQQSQARKDLLKSVAANVPEAILNKNVTELELSVRSRKALQRLGVSSVGELATRTEAELLGVKNFGQTSLLEIKQRLTEMGLGLRKLD
ncbi:MAG TPA: DNA-directed RNA polymerase subunit alpha C-terminal domain-containing protein [Phycisphaerae bacterium]|nr:DNA-directed RNA polymerase subunit alpha C-terminal domain-containing protein [Phycisphaerae bacterium]